MPLTPEALAAIDAWADAQVAAAPPLGADQIANLARAFAVAGRPGRQGVAAA